MCRRSKSEETLCSLLITTVEETSDIRSRVNHGKQIMNLKSGYVEEENRVDQTTNLSFTRVESMSHHRLRQLSIQGKMGNISSGEETFIIGMPSVA